MIEWILEQIMKLLLSTAISGVVWVALVGGLGWTTSFWLIWIVVTLLVFGIIFWLEHGPDHWDVL